MTTLKISVALCTYNGERYLQEQLDSIARQTRLPDEVILCDDNSSDHSVAIINRFSSVSPFPLRIYKNQSNIGSTKNFEQAISLCAGDIIVLSDQDDVWSDDKLKLLEEGFNSSMQIGVVFSNGNVVSENLSPLGYTLWDTYCFGKKTRMKFMNGKAFEIELNHNVITGATMAFRASYKSKILPISPFWVHDSWIALLMSSISEIKFIDKALINYRQHKQQQIGGMKMKIAGQMALAHSVTDYKKQIAQYKLIIEHIQKCKFETEYNIVSRIADKIKHLNSREDIYNAKGIHKMIKAGGELLSGRYHEYSNGFKSFVKDIVTSFD